MQWMRQESAYEPLRRRLNKVQPGGDRRIQLNCGLKPEEHQIRNGKASLCDPRERSHHLH